jgi:hypothetical protein
MNRLDDYRALALGWKHTLCGREGDSQFPELAPGFTVVADASLPPDRSDKKQEMAQKYVFPTIGTSFIKMVICDKYLVLSGLLGRLVLHYASIDG